MKRKYGGGIKRRVFSFSVTPDHPDADLVIPALEQAAQGKQRSEVLVAAYASYLRKKQAQSDLPDARHP